MVDVGDVTQGAVDGVLDDVIGQLRGQTNLGLGSKDYVEGVLKRALGTRKIGFCAQPHTSICIK